MILLNWLLGLGALAFTIPLAIHLLFRNRRREVAWGAMQFLEAVVQVNRRRVQLRHWLLLLIRCAIPILLALCMARPVLTGWQQPRGDQPMAMVIVLDTSYSMSARDDQGRQKLERAADAARQILTALARGSEVTLLTSDGEVRRGDPAMIAAQLQTLTVGGPAAELDSLLSRALRLVHDNTLAHRQIVLLSDHVASDFSQATLDALPAIGQRLRALAPQPELCWIDPLADFSAPSHNRRMHRTEPAVAVAVAGQSVPWRLEAQIDGGELSRVDFQVRVDGELVEQQTAAVHGSTASTTVNLRLDRVGRHAVEVAVVASDPLGPLAGPDRFPADDRLWRDFQVIQPIDVVLVDGTPGAGPLAGDTDFLAIALSPFALGEPPAGQQQPRDRFVTRKVQVGRLAELADSAPLPRVVVLANVARPTSADCRWLADFVANQGGTLVVFAGESIDPAWYDANLISAANSDSGTAAPLLPYRFGPVQRAEPLRGIDDSRLTYPPLATFAQQEAGSLSSVQVRAWRELIPRDRGGEVQEVLRLEGGQPLMVLRSVGRGQVLQVATTSDPSWTTLPLRPVFVPLMQRLFAHLALGGQPLAARSAGQPIVLGEVAAGSRWTVQTPDGQTHRLEAAAIVPPTSPPAAAATARSSETLPEPPTATLTWPATRTAGAYRFESQDFESKDQVIWASVGVPAADLQPARVDVATRRAAAERMGATFYDSLDAYFADESTRRFGRGLWHVGLVALLAALLLEPVVQQSRIRGD